MAGSRAVWHHALFRDYGQSPANHILSGIYYDILRCSSIIHGYKTKGSTVILENNHIVNRRCRTGRGYEREPFMADMGIW